MEGVEGVGKEFGVKGLGFKKVEFPEISKEFVQEVIVGEF